MNPIERDMAAIILPVLQGATVQLTNEELSEQVAHALFAKGYGKIPDIGGTVEKMKSVGLW